MGSGTIRIKAAALSWLVERRRWSLWRERSSREGPRGFEWEGESRGVRELVVKNGGLDGYHRFRAIFLLSSNGWVYDRDGLRDVNVGYQVLDTWKFAT